VSSSKLSVCVLRLSAIGDVCNAVAAIQALQKTHPKAKITWIIGRIEHSLLEGMPGIEFVVFDKRQGKQALAEFKQTMKGREFDVLLHMQVALRASLLSRHIKAKRRIGFDRVRSKELQRWFINERIRPRAQAHVLEGFFDFVIQLGVSTDAEHSPTWNIPVRDTDQAHIDQWVTPDTSALVIVPAASNQERNWIAERYAQVADHASQKGFQVFVCGGPTDAEKRLADTISSFCRMPVTNLVGHTSLKQLLCLLGRAQLVVCPDTGPAHMAVSQGTPVIGLYGHSNPARTGPYLFQHWVVETYHTHLAHQTGKDAQSNVWGKRVKGDHVMADISVNAVIARLDDVCTQLGLPRTRSDA